MKLQQLFDEILLTDFSAYSALMFNLYEDKMMYTMEAVFGDEEFIIGRDDPAELEPTSEDFNLVLLRTSQLLSDFISENASSFHHLLEISYGFVDGDLEYIRPINL